MLKVAIYYIHLQFKGEKVLGDIQTFTVNSADD